MADLIQLDVVVRDKGLKESLSTVERLERQIIKAAKAVDQNRISQERYNKILLSAKREYESLGMKSQKATAQVRRFADAQRDLSTAVNAGGVAAQQTARKTNQLGVLMQQTGYQVGDFAVQVQSGTNVMVALGQQATQLVGTFAMLARSTAAIAAFSALGVIVPIVTAIAGAFMRTAKSAEEAKDKVTGLTKTLEDFRQEQRALEQSITTDQLALVDRVNAIKELREEQLQLIKDLQSNSNASNIMNVDLSVAERMSALIGAAFDPSKQADAESTINALNDLMDKALDQQRELQVKINTEYLKRVRSMEDANKLASIENRFGQDHVKYRNEVRRQAEVALELEIKQAGITELVAKRLRDRLSAEYDIIDAKADQDELDRLALARQEAITNSTKAAIAVAIQMTAAIEEREEAVKEIQKTHNDELKNLKDQIDLIRVEAQYGKDSVQLEKVKAALAREAYEQSRIDAGIKGNLLKVEMETYDELQRQKETLADINEEERQRLLLVKEQLKFYERQADRQMRLNQSPMFINTDSLDAAAKIYKDRLEEIEKGQDEAAKAAEKLNDKIQELEDAADPFREYNRELKDLDKLLKSGKISQQAYNKAVDDLNEGLGASIQIIGDVEQAFSDWLSRGLDDFKGFVSSIKDMFVKLLADLAAQAVRNRILIPISTGFMAGMGSTAAATTMGGMKAGTMGSTLAGYGAAIGTGLSNFGSATLHTITGGTAGSVAAGSTMATIGAAAPYILAAVAVIGLFTSKVKKLDQGIRVTVDGTNTLVESFELLQKSRLFGLLKGKKFTEYEEVQDSPLVGAVAGMQQSIVDAAGTLGIGSAAFDNFSYQFKLSLKGLTEEEQLQKVNEEITKMGDAFASLSGHFETMNELLQVAQQRYDLETRLLGLLNDQSALLTRQREVERASVHELNQGTLTQIYALEDAYGAVNSAFALVQRSIEARKKAITDGFNSIMDALQARIKTAQDAVGVSRGILGSLEGAGDSGMTRGAGMAYLRSLRGASRITDQKKLDEALQAIADPSQDLYTNFVDYQRDFQDQANIVRELEEKAALQLSTDEQTLLQLQEEATAAQERYNEQMENLDEQLLKAQEQLDALMGIDKSVQSVEQALGALGNAISGAMAAQQAAAKAASEQAAASGGGATGKSFSEQYGTGSQYKGYDLAKLSGSGDLLNAAGMLGVGTSGKTGAQIQQEVSNASGMAVRLDNATRSQQFAMGGMFGGGYRMVGERGPEIEATGPSRIFSTKQTAELFRNPELVEEVRSLRAEVAGLRSENRQIQASNSKYVKRNYDINRKWDTEGLPTTRT